MALTDRAGRRDASQRTVQSPVCVRFCQKRNQQTPLRTFQNLLRVNLYVCCLPLQSMKASSSVTEASVPRTTSDPTGEATPGAGANLSSAGRLVDHDPGMREAPAVAGLPRSLQQGASSGSGVSLRRRACGRRARGGVRSAPPQSSDAPEEATPYWQPGRCRACALGSGCTAGESSQHQKNECRAFSSQRQERDSVGLVT